jgi:hypothetical protein
MPALPPPPAVKFAPAEAAAIAKRGRKLMRAGRITHKQWAVLDRLLWSCRNPTSGAIVVSFSGLQKLAKVGRATAAGAVKVLERLRVLSRIKRRILVVWHQGGQQSRQATNAYVLHPPRHSEFTVEPYFRGIELKSSTSGSRRQLIWQLQRPHWPSAARLSKQDCSRGEAA